MSARRSLIRADRPIVVRREQEDEWTAAIFFEEPLPYVALVTDRVLAAPLQICKRMLRIHGYRAVDRDWSMRATRFVRPMPLWALHWLGVRAHRGFWGSLQWLYEKGLIRLANQPHEITRLRDIRVWPMGGRSYT